MYLIGLVPRSSDPHGNRGARRGKDGNSSLLLFFLPFLLLAFVSVFFMPREYLTKYLRAIRVYGKLSNDFQRCLTLVFANAPDHEITLAARTIVYCVSAFRDQLRGACGSAGPGSSAAAGSSTIPSIPGDPTR